MSRKKLRSSLKTEAPSTRYEQELWAAGNDVVVGVDEVGRGAWAGPVSVAAAVIPSDSRIYKVRDSKLLKETEREELFGRLTSWCRYFSVGHASEVECDELGMSAAQKLAASRAIAALGVSVDHVLVDGSWDFVSSAGTDFGVTKLVKGDRFSLSIAAASVIAKVVRDQLMVEASELYPAYDFASNKGYPSPKHREALAEIGACEIHRHSWSFMADLPESPVTLRAQPNRLF